MLQKISQKIDVLIYYYPIGLGITIFIVAATGLIGGIELANFMRMTASLNLKLITIGILIFLMEIIYNSVFTPKNILNAFSTITKEKLKKNWLYYTFIFKGFSLFIVSFLMSFLFAIEVLIRLFLALPSLTKLIILGGSVIFTILIWINGKKFRK